MICKSIRKSVNANSSFSTIVTLDPKEYDILYYVQFVYPTGQIQIIEKVNNRIILDKTGFVGISRIFLFEKIEGRDLIVNLYGGQTQDTGIVVLGYGKKVDINDFVKHSFLFEPNPQNYY